MLKQFRRQLINHLWAIYRHTTPQIQLIEKKLHQKNQSIILDHFAIIDLPGPHTGISYLHQLFSAIGYIVQGMDYLPDKQNDFLWMTEYDSKNADATAVLPQVVVADFRLDALPLEIRKIIEKYAQQSPPAILTAIQKLAGRVFFDDVVAAKTLETMILHYFRGRDWPLPTIKEFSTVQEFNELLAWVLIFGRRPNHFTLSVHLFTEFVDLQAFHRFIQEDVQLTLNCDGGMIKGGQQAGIAQSSTTGMIQTIQLSDGYIHLPTGFVEFVWRYPRAGCQHPVLWNDFFTGFIAQHATHVIESLYI